MKQFQVFDHDKGKGLTMTQPAKIAANLFANRSDNIYHGSVYQDGVLLYLAVAERTAQKWADALKATKLPSGCELEDYACSDDGFVWCFVLRGNASFWAARAFTIGEQLQKDWEKCATLMEVDDLPVGPRTIDAFWPLAERLNQPE